MSEMQIVLVHGWGYAPAVFDRLTPLLGPVETVDLGFFGPPRTVPPPARRRLLVAHSFGLLWWLCRQPFAVDGIVSLNGFARFSAADDFPAGIAPRVIARMRRRLRQDAGAVLHDFRARCGDPAPDAPATADLDRLDWGLAALAEWDGRAALKALRLPIRALAACNDAIAPPADTTFDRLDLIAGGDHLLPRSHPTRCAAAIDEVLALP